MNSTDLAGAIKDLARRAGFLAAGIAPAGPVAQATRLHAWLERGYCADMDFMRRNLAQRCCPAELVRGARSVICLAASYAPPPGADRDGMVARYARGADYHKVLKRRSAALVQAIRAIEPGFLGRAFVDSGPVMERSLAAAAGLGWTGRNGCVFVDGAGSYCVLAEIVCNLPLPADSPQPGRCGDCRACVAACPTGALHDDGLVDARRCISYLTIEHRGTIDPSLWPRMGVRLFGCDACQAVCPHNRDLPAGDSELAGAAPLGGAGLVEVFTWPEAHWRQATAGSATRRATHEMFLRNAILAAGNSGDASLAAPLRAIQGSAPHWAELAGWALARLSGEADNPFDASTTPSV
ncbi:MAG: tRNA epoxyqueuosine(34) reductase QueG [Phycisphaerae bacterium]|nr:tRNA epoxyqueuosine(34) reductase QueG [Phycisphaerae bacterium]